MSHTWLDSEADNWYKRNKEDLGKLKDIALFLTDLYALKPKKVLEIGAANGYRLAKIHQRYQSAVSAIEPSKLAVHDGRQQYPFIKFIHSTCEDAPLTDTFDLVIMNFVFHWIKRGSLYRCVANIDQWVDQNGYLLIGDFGTDYYFKRKYHHIKSEEVYTWKMAYEDMFIKSGQYIEVAKLRFDDNTHEFDPNLNLDSMGSMVLLKKKEMFVERVVAS